MEEISRREFIRRLAALALGAGALLSHLGCRAEKPTPQKATPTTAPPPKPTPTVLPKATVAPTPMATAPPIAAPTATAVPTPDRVDLAVARGGSPAEITRAAIEALGGMERFVRPGDRVIVKPNICTAAHTFEYAATTNPEVVATIVALCLEAGAREVRVMDYPFQGTADAAYERSGIKEAVEKAGGRMEIMSRTRYEEVPIPQGRDIKKWPVYRDVLEADVLINVPIAKHHTLARLTLGMKNLMGVILNRPLFHLNLGQRIADLVSLVRPTLTVVDAVRILVRHGPTGGSLDDVRRMDTVIAGPDIVAADSYAATLFGLKGEDIAYIRIGHEMGLGEMDLSRLRIKEIR